MVGVNSKSDSFIDEVGVLGVLGVVGIGDPKSLRRDEVTLSLSSSLALAAG